MFSSLVTGLFASRSGLLSVSPETPEPMVPSQNASMSSSATPASARAADVESMSMSSVLLSQCSPNGVHPIPMMATWSRMPCDAMGQEPPALERMGRAFQK